MRTPAPILTLHVSVPRWQAIALVVAFALAGCGPAVRSASFATFPPRAPDHLIQVFSTKTPDCDYEEVGLVSARKRTRFVSMDEVLAALKERARSMGGDAVIAVSEGQQVSGGGTEVITVSSDPVLSGTVIRFTDEACSR